MIQKLFDYWSMWHLLLTTYAYLIGYFILGFSKGWTFAAVFILAFIYEASEWIWNRRSYPSKKAMLLNNLKDLGMSLLALTVTALILHAA